MFIYMNIFFLEPPFDDWTTIINNLKIPNVSIIKNENSILNIKYLMEIIKNNNCIIIPLKYEDIKFITSNIIPEYIHHFLCPRNYETIEILNNKTLFYQFMIENNFQKSIPKTYKINDKLLNPIIYPCIFKLPITFGGHGSHICYNKYQLDTYENTNIEYFIQEFISGPIEYSAHLFVLDGVIKYGVCYSTIHNIKVYIQRGKMTKYKKILNFDFDKFSEIFMKLKYTGFACVDFKIINNSIKIFEINPRLGGTIVHDQDDFNKLILYLKENYSNLSVTKYVDA